MAANCLFNAPAIAGPLRFGALRSSNGFKQKNTMPAFGATLNPLMLKPGKPPRSRRRLFQADVRHAADHRFRAVERERVRQLRKGDQVLFILRRHEAGRDFVETPAGEKHQPAINNQRDGALAQHAADAGGIFVAGPGKQRD